MKWEINKMDSKENTVDRIIDPSGQDQAETDGPKLGIRARIIVGLRTRIRRLFKKEDPNIYPFF